MEIIPLVVYPTIPEDKPLTEVMKWLWLQIVLQQLITWNMYVHCSLRGGPQKTVLFCVDSSVSTCLEK